MREQYLKREEERNKVTPLKDLIGDLQKRDNAFITKMYYDYDLSEMMKDRSEPTSKARNL